MSWPVDCANCGKQTLIDAPGDKCIWCGKSATKMESSAVADGSSKETVKKEVKLMVTEDEKTKYAGMSMQDRGKWLTDHMEEIVADIRSMPEKEVFKKWPFALSTLYKIMRIHTPELVGKPATEHERYLVLLGYQMAVREYLKAITTKPKTGKPLTTN